MERSTETMTYLHSGDNLNTSDYDGSSSMDIGSVRSNGNHTETRDTNYDNIVKGSNAQEHKNKVSSYIASGVEQGATLVLDGRQQTLATQDDGFFIGPTIFDSVTPSMSIYQDEIFGPVLSVVRVDSLSEAIELVNDHEYGNGTSIFTSNGNSARTFQEKISVGMVGVNIPIPVPMAFHSFGGWKRSIFGPLNMHGPDGVRFFTRMKTVTARWSSEQSEGPNFSIPTSE